MISICPKGWYLPKYAENQSFVNLTSIYLSIDKNSSGLATTVEEAFRGNPSSFIHSGNYDYSTSTLVSRGSGGRYWSSRAHSATHAYYLNFYSTGIYPQYNDGKGNGFALRCVAR